MRCRSIARRRRTGSSPSAGTSGRSCSRREAADVDAARFQPLILAGDPLDLPAAHAGVSKLLHRQAATLARRNRTKYTDGVRFVRHGAIVAWIRWRNSARLQRDCALVRSGRAMTSALSLRLLLLLPR